MWLLRKKTVIKTHRPLERIVFTIAILLGPLCLGAKIQKIMALTSYTPSRWLTFFLPLKQKTKADYFYAIPICLSWEGNVWRKQEANFATLFHHFLSVFLLPNKSHKWRKRLEGSRSRDRTRNAKKAKMVSGHFPIGKHYLSNKIC